MKIVFLQDDFPPLTAGGAGVSTYELAQGMKSRGHEIFVITTCRKKEDAGLFQYDGLTVHRVHAAYPFRWRAFVSLYNWQTIGRVNSILADIRPNIVHINNVHQYLSYHCFSVAKKYAKVVYTARDTMAIQYGKLQTETYLKNLDTKVSWVDQLRQAKHIWNPFRNIFIRNYVAHADAKCAVSGALARALEDNGLAPVKPILTAIDLSVWKGDESRVEGFRNAHNLQGKKVILFGGRLSAEKGAEKAIDALYQVRKEVPNAILLVVGTVDAYANALKAEAEKKGMGGAIVYTGWISGSDLHAAYFASDIVLVPSLYLDPLPRIALEGMAAGKPIVATRYGGAPEAVVDGKTGTIIDPRNADEIARACIEFLTDPKKAEQFGIAGRARMEKDFDMERYIEQYLVCYQELLTDHLT